MYKLALFSLCLVVASCGASRTDAVYLIDVNISAGVAAANDRTITIADRQMPAFSRGPVTAESFLELCTSSRTHFLQARLPIVVKDANGTIVSMATLTTVACSQADESGPREQAHLYLEDDGALLADPLTANDPRVWAACLDLTAPYPCHDGDDF